MCEPVTATALAIGTAAAVSSYAESKARNAQAKAEEQAAKSAAAYDKTAIDLRRHQINRSVDLEIFERQRQALRERSRIAVAAGEAGVAGNSPARMIAQSMLDAAHDIGVHQANRESLIAQTMLEEQAIKAGRDSRVNIARSQMTNPFMSALMIGGRTTAAYLGAPRIPS